MEKQQSDQQAENWLVHSLGVEDPVGSLGLEEYGRALRRGQISAVAATEFYLQRISTLDPILGAFVSIDAAAACASAQVVEQMLAAGTDLGPLMGVPIAVKDIFALKGSRTSAGSRLDVDPLVGPQGSFVTRLRSLGCVILGKTRTTEFAFTPSGINRSTGTPRNPHDAFQNRIPGGSSSGSAVAVAAGMCGFAIGSDTGGSVRVPSALNGVVGLKTTTGLWPTDGVFSLSTTLDTIGLITRTVADAASIYACLQGERISPAPTSMLNFAVPRQYYLDDLDPEVAIAFDGAKNAILAANVRIDDIDVPEAAERAPMLAQIMAAELIASLGRERLVENIDLLDAAVKSRIEANLGVTADYYVKLRRRQHQLELAMTERMRGWSAWFTPTVPCTAPVLVDIGSLASEMDLNLRLTRCTQPVNLFGQCAISIPAATAGSLPVGLQLAGAPGSERALLEAALAVEKTVGQAPRANLAALSTL